MGIEKISATTKLDPVNLQFCQDIARSFEPFEVSLSSLLNTFVTILRLKVAVGEIDMSPIALQRFSRHLGNEGFSRNLGNEERKRV